MPSHAPSRTVDVTPVQAKVNHVKIYLALNTNAYNFLELPTK